jgi:hypothetical protein
MGCMRRLKNVRSCLAPSSKTEKSPCSEIADVVIAASMTGDVQRHDVDGRFEGSARPPRRGALPPLGPLGRACPVWAAVTHIRGPADDDEMGTRVSPQAPGLLPARGRPPHGDPLPAELTSIFSGGMRDSGTSVHDLVLATTAAVRASAATARRPWRSAAPSTGRP